MKKRLLIAAAGMLAIVAAACSSDEPAPTAVPQPTSTPVPTATPVPTSTPEPTSVAVSIVDQDPKQYDLVSGWYRGEAVMYYDFGTESPVDGPAVSAAPIWAFITGFDTEGNPQFVEGQHNIVNVVPGDESYSDLWQVNLVTVPEDYVPDSITSLDELMASGLDITATDLFVNCPIVPAGSTLEGGEELTQGWYKGQEVFYPDFGFNPAAAIPIWAFITGFDADGNPQFVEGQNNVIDSIPSDTGYSAFWQVNLVMVPETYEANTITSRSDLDGMGYEIVQPGIVVNCPVTVFPEA